MNKFFDWLTTSSANPEATALTVKGLVVTYLPLILVALKFFGHDVQPDVNSLGNQVESLVIVLLGIPGALMTAYGLIRKIILTIAP